MGELPCSTSKGARGGASRASGAFEAIRDWNFVSFQDVARKAKREMGETFRDRFFLHLVFPFIFHFFAKKRENAAVVAPAPLLRSLVFFFFITSIRICSRSSLRGLLLLPSQLRPLPRLGRLEQLERRRRSS